MMKRNIISFGVISALIITLAACTKEAAPVQPEGPVAVPFEFSAAITKTANDGEGTIWTAGDAANLFHSLTGTGEYSANGQFTISAEDLEAKKFKGTLSAALENGKSYDWVAFYPYSSTNTSPSAVKVNLGTAVQNGDDDMTHVAGENFPLWGVATRVEGELTMQMKHLSSLLEVEVLNSTAEKITVSSVAFTAQEEIAGEFTVDLTSLTPAFAAVSGKASKTSSLAVKGAQNIEKGSSAKYYLAVKPFTAPAGSALVLSVNGIDYEIDLKSEVVFAPGAIKTLKFDYDKTAAPTVTIKNVAFSSADLEWTSDGLAKAFNIYVNGEKVVSELAADVLTYHLTGLVSGVESVIEVEAVGDHNAAKSAQQTLKTLGVRLLDKGRCHFTIEWDETNPYPAKGSYSGFGIEEKIEDIYGGRGYEIAVYTDADCDEEYYSLYPYSGSAYVYGNSSWYGQIGDVNMMVPTKLSLGYLKQNTTYYVRVRSVSGVTLGSNTLMNIAGTSEWSNPLEVKTLPARTPEADEVIFADFDEFCWNTDRKNGCPGTMVSGNMYTGSLEGKSMLAIPMGDFPNKDLNVYCDFVEKCSGSTGYFTGATFNANNASCTNYVGKAGSNVEGWHFTNSVRANMACLMIDRAQNRFIGTPALTTNLKEDELTACLLSFDLGTVCRENSSYPMMVKVYRNSQLTTVYKFTVSARFKGGVCTSTDYQLDFSPVRYEVPLTLMKGDAVLLVVDGIGGTGIVYTVDNFKIVVDPDSPLNGNGSLEIPDWGSDNDGLEI